MRIRELELARRDDREANEQLLTEQRQKFVSLTNEKKALQSELAKTKEAIAVATKLGRQAEELCLQQNKTIGKLTERNRELETRVRDLESGKKTSTTADAA